MKFIQKSLLVAIIASILAIGGAAIFVRENYNHAATQEADCAVVFGAAVWPGLRPSHALADRTQSGIDLFFEGATDCLIFSGADREPDVMKNMALAAGVEEEKISQDFKGENTLATLKHLDQKKSYILISNDFHLARIKLLAWRLDLDTQLHAAKYQRGRYLKESYFFWREVAGMIFYFFQIKL
ncbi:YdcF family protein [bacterium]|jgi:vancomycin permeability regulator SanA|nr:YdcF family protein [bacterium]MBT6832036.1 YdcF family protein [bacterium]MBT6995817.1 YdcF family protein [bacterium]MBT7772372.1 YdcF family protein [bacterium]